MDFLINNLNQQLNMVKELMNTKWNKEVRNYRKSEEQRVKKQWVSIKKWKLYKETNINSEAGKDDN